MRYIHSSKEPEFGRLLFFSSLLIIVIGLGISLFNYRRGIETEIFIPLKMMNQVNNSTSYLFHSTSASRTGQRRERRCQTASRLGLVIQECERCADATCAIPRYGVLSVMRWATLSDQGGGVVYCIRT